jgi:diguanylate cyclase (GGDEF)-like protein
MVRRGGCDDIRGMRGRRWRGWTAVCVAAASALAVLALAPLPTSTATGLASAMHVVAMGVALVVLVRGARNGDGLMRRTRYCFAGAVLATVVGALAGLGYVVAQGSIPVPSLGDISLAWVPLAVVGFWLVPTRNGRSAGTLRLVTDGAVAASSLFFISWLLAIEPLWQTGRWSATGRAVEMLYPLCDVFVAAVALAVLPRARSDVRELINYAAAGLLLIAFSDSWSTVLLAERGVIAFGWPDATIQAGLVMLIFGAIGRPRSQPERRSYSTIDHSVLYIPVLVAMCVGIWHLADGNSFTLREGIPGAVMLTAIVVRQIVFTRELSRAADRHRYAAAHDGLTGLANRKAFFDRLGEHLRTPGSGTAAVLLFDLDGFKEINDSFGHDVGDEVLASFAAALREQAPSELVARLGGDEFAMLVTGDDLELRAVSMGNHLAAGRRLATAGRGALQVSCSIGIALSRPDDASESLLRRADLAMYVAKRSPMSRLACFSDEMAVVADRRHLLAAALDGATERREMSLVYQPLYRLCDRSLAGAEALLRWEHPRFGAVSPSEFIPIAEDTGCIDAIGAWVLEQAVAQVAAWRHSGHELPWLFVNVSAPQFTDELPDLVRSALARHGVRPGQLILEITESQVPAFGASRPMQRLREMGVRIAVDDFGSGYSSFAQLARLPVDILKIDREVIANLGHVGGRPVLDAIIGLATALGLSTVAEGIEHGDDAEQATNAGIDFVQGFFFSRPLSADAVTSLLDSGSIPAPRVSLDPASYRLAPS